MRKSFVASSPPSRPCSIRAGCGPCSPLLSSNLWTARLRLFEYEIDASSFLRVKSLPDAVESARRGGPDSNEPSYLLRSPARSATTRRRCFSRLKRLGEQPDLAIAMAEIFAGEIDFNTELQPGDRYAMAFERLEREGRPIIVRRDYGG